ncbi:MAG: hypothetical protein GX348_05335 [Veillonellaceae bacterium]|jgi:hypothetical protein|nr:hypothetical protein [Veillonellaceae bacterium]
MKSKKKQKNPTPTTAPKANIVKILDVFFIFMGVFYIAFHSQMETSSLTDLGVGACLVAIAIKHWLIYKKNKS